MNRHKYRLEVRQKRINDLQKEAEERHKKRRDEIDASKSQEILHRGFDKHRSLKLCDMRERHKRIHGESVPKQGSSCVKCAKNSNKLVSANNSYVEKEDIVKKVREERKKILYTKHKIDTGLKKTTNIRVKNKDANSTATSIMRTTKASEMEVACKSKKKQNYSVAMSSSQNVVNKKKKCKEMRQKMHSSSQVGKEAYTKVITTHITTVNGKTTVEKKEVVIDNSQQEL